MCGKRPCSDEMKLPTEAACFIHCLNRVIWNIRLNVCLLYSKSTFVVLTVVASDYQILTRWFCHRQLGEEGLTDVFSFDVCGKCAALRHSQLFICRFWNMLMMPVTYLVLGWAQKQEAYRKEKKLSNYLETVQNVSISHILWMEI